jgi:hypothetical protein
MAAGAICSWEKCGSIQRSHNAGQTSKSANALLLLLLLLRKICLRPPQKVVLMRVVEPALAQKADRRLRGFPQIYPGRLSNQTRTAISTPNSASTNEAPMIAKKTALVNVIRRPQLGQVNASLEI